MVVQEYLEFFASAYNITGKQRTRIVGDVLELTDLAHKSDALVDSLSRGMQQRLSIARVLLHDPKVLLLDEPASGLDPRARIEIRELLKELHKMGKTIIISSHILHELAELCTTVGIIEQGQMLVKEPISQIIRRVKTGSKLHVSIVEQQDLAALLLQKARGIKSVEQENGHLLVELEEQTHDFTAIASLLIQNNFRISEIKEEEVNLETAFMRLTKGIVQ